MSRVSEALIKKGIGPKAVAALLGVTEKTAWNKLNAQTEFAISEALTIKKELLPEYDIEYLFAQDTTEKEG